MVDFLFLADPPLDEAAVTKAMAVAGAATLLRAIIGAYDAVPRGTPAV